MIFNICLLVVFNSQCLVCNSFLSFFNWFFISDSMRPFAANPILGYKGRRNRNRLTKWKKRLKSELLLNHSKLGECICFKEVQVFLMAIKMNVSQENRE